MDGKVVYFSPDPAFFNFKATLYEVLFPICSITWRANNYASRQEKV